MNQMNMDYELAKALKDAGFPQSGDSQLWFSDVYIPTLSEIIEACGEDFGSLTKVVYDSVDKWECRDRTGYIEIVEHTPEEAVAKLWLELSNTNHGYRPNNVILRSRQLIR